MAIEIVDFPIQNKMVIFHSYVSSPEGMLLTINGDFP